MAKMHIISENITCDVILSTKKKVEGYRAMLSNEYGSIIYELDEKTVSLLHDLNLVRNGNSPKIYI